MTSAQVVVQRQEDKKTIKVGLNNNADVKALVKQPLYKFEDLATITSGIGISGLLKNDVKVKTGFQMDINL